MMYAQFDRKIGSCLILDWTGILIGKNLTNVDLHEWRQLKLYESNKMNKALISKDWGFKNTNVGILFLLYMSHEDCVLFLFDQFDENLIVRGL